jgi:hypothetical protein
MEVARELAEGQYGRWAEPERLIINVMAIYRELSPEPPPPTPLMDRFSVIAEFDEAIRATA